MSDFVRRRKWGRTRVDPNIKQNSTRPAWKDFRDDRKSDVND